MTMDQDAAINTAMADVSVPTLPMRDVRETRAFYEALGFICAHEHEAPDSFLFMVRGGAMLQFFPAHVDTRASTHTFQIMVDDLEGTFAAFKGAGVGNVLPIELKPWGIREFALVDPNGTLMRIAHAKFEIK
ncbi:MAG: VOC family protein [Alphaproteobacteria bacterium]|nr:VOC family protein [Alphaproteobacteria bacterium]